MQSAFGEILENKDMYILKDDPIFLDKHTIPNPKASVKKPIKIKKEKLQEHESFFDGAKEIKRKE